jgi:hypothetical protein
VSDVVTFKKLCSLGIDDHYWRLVAWWGCVAVSMVFTILWWPLGLVPFVLLLGFVVRATKAR